MKIVVIKTVQNVETCQGNPSGRGNPNARRDQKDESSNINSLYPEHIFPIVHTWDKKAKELIQVDSVYDPVRRFGSLPDWFDDTERGR